MALPIPKRHFEGLNLLRKLSDTSADELLKALDSAKIASTPSGMADRIAASVKTIPLDDIRQIMSLLYGLYHVREFSKLNKNDFLREALEGVLEHASPKVPNDEVPAIRQRLKEFMRLNTLEKLSKALVLQQQHEHLYCGAKITSDIRPVFGEDIKSTPVGAVISHILTISYHEEGKHRDFFVALDDFDLNALEKLIRRAKAKDETLSGVLENSGIARLGI
jgi:hypothetical protein